ncbi:DUF4231 domain-containing protein [Actinacidiphila glaucinigra]|uniref:DUF4231 domain-containing protein n=1 Tax=Actinacidiphila glaucinigra TaxID=235986 RepID=UPI002DD7BF9E|nr:DUF4231 domain-containing protein [Actinacidiphila glaucinigra]WSD60106.1 DUF4231 domain-containing protein [Actinacidiphila glaucinigra]
MEHNERILSLEEEIRARKISRRMLTTLGSAVIFGVISSFTLTVITWRHFDMRPYNQIAIPFAVASAIGFASLASSVNPRTGIRGMKRYEKSIRRLQLDLELALEARRLNASELALPVRQRQYSYKEDIPRELDNLRSESRHYRRIHNGFQTVIIMGSLGTTTAASVAETPSTLKWITVGLSFSVGISAGFTGYFKYKERGFYLQQTADSIEQHITAFELGVSPYDGAAEEANLLRLTKEIEALRVEQRKRQQQLDQPHDGRDTRESV